MRHLYGIYTLTTLLFHSLYLDAEVLRVKRPSRDDPGLGAILILRLQPPLALVHHPLAVAVDDGCFCLHLEAMSNISSRPLPSATVPD